MRTRLLILLALAQLSPPAVAFRILTSPSDPVAATRAAFEPYVKGGVGYYGDPANPDPERVNEGSPFSPDTPRVYLTATPKQNCPGMVGPINEQEYYCHGREYGYCDRRSGLCVCNQGYTGLDCTDCKPSYFKKGNLCYPKKSCKKYDPRCLVCNSSRCLQCADLLLNSVRRSGARKVDAPLPFDEQMREFSFKFSYGSQDPRVFDEAEVFQLLPPSTTPRYLNDSSASCVQGQNFDASWSCQPNPVSHRVCGHAGVFSFTSPVYAVPETARNISLTVQRSGGGLGPASVMYDLQHISTSAQDVTPTAFYTSSQTLQFADGVINMTFLLTIHDDRAVESNETFRVVLRSPSDGSTLGNQRQALVAIIDNDLPLTDATLTYLVPSSTVLQKGGYAGDTLKFQVQSVLGDGSAKKTGGDLLLMESYVADEAPGAASFLSLYRPKLVGQVTDHANGTYTVTWQRKHAGTYTVAVYLLYSGGIRGDYYADAWLSGVPVVSRVDRQLNFTWNGGPVFPGASDYVGVRWNGRIKPKVTGGTTIFVDCDDHVRLWIGDVLLIDRWSQENDGGVQAQAVVFLDSSVFYALQLEYRDLTGDARFSLSWSATGLAKQIIPASSLYTAQHILGSPFTNIPMLPALTSNAATSYLQGTFATIAGTPLSLQLFPVDAYGNARSAYDPKIDYYQANLTLVADQSLGGIGSKNVACDVAWRNDKPAFNVTCIPFFSGSHNLNVYLNNFLVTGSPFVVTVQPNRMHPSRSVLSGAGLTPSRVAGTTTAVQLETRDLQNNRIYTSSRSTVNLILRAIHTAKSGVVDLGTLTDNADGTYTFSYTPRFVGTYLVHVTQNGVSIHNSPYSVTVVPGVAVGSTSVATGSGLNAAATNTQSSFQIQSRDSNANDLVAGGAVYQVIIEQTPKGNVNGACTDFLNSKYSCTYTPKYVGASRLHVGLLSGAAFMPILGSPFSINVVAGPALGSMSFAKGSALVASIAGQTATFIVVIRDAFDNDKLNAGTEFVSLAFVGPAPSTTAVPVANTGLQVVYNNDGTYNVSYNLQNKGSYQIQVQVNGVAIRSSPFSMYTYPASAAYTTTTVDLVSPTMTPLVYYAGSPITARITTRDAFGNTLESGGSLFEFSKALSNATLVDSVGLVDETNGSYIFKFTPKIAQSYELAQRIMYPGGLNATFFGSADLVGTAKLKRVDPTIDFDFGVAAPFQTDDRETFSIRWSGYLLPLYSEIYTIHVTVVGGCTMQIQEQMLFASLWPTATNATAHEQIALTANKLVPFHANFSKTQLYRNASIRVEWESLSQRREVIPARWLFTGWTFVDNVPAINVVPDMADSPSFTAVFPAGSYQDPSVVTATAGEVFEFRVTARDRFGNVRLVGGDRIFVLFPQFPDDLNVIPSVADLDIAVYDVSTTPILRGNFSMVVAATRMSDVIYLGMGTISLVEQLRPFLIQQSPFTLQVIPNKPLATTSTLVGDGIVRAVAGVTNQFTVELRDLYGNRVQTLVPRDKITVKLRLLSNPTVAVDGAYDDAADGLVNVNYTATGTGFYEILLAVLDGVLVQKTSMLRVIPNLASAVTSSVSGSGLGPQVQALAPQSFQVSVRDFYQNLREFGGDNLAVEVRGPTTLYGEVVDLQTGQYLVQYQLPLVGVYEIQTMLANPGRGLVGSYFDTTQFANAGLALASQWVDPQLDFDWNANQTMRNYPRIQWRGYLKPRFTEIYTLRLTVLPAAAVYIDNAPIIDLLNTDSAVGTTSVVSEGKVSLVGGQLHRLVVEYRSTSRREISGSLRLEWRSDRQSPEVIPTSALLPDGQEIRPRFSITAV